MKYSYKEEQAIYEALLAAGYNVVPEDQSPSRLDFTVGDIGIEFKSHHSPRAIEQMARVSDGILIQGPKAAAFFVQLLKAGAAR